MPFSSQYGSLFEQNSEQFDFNIDFEQVFFAIIPSALFIIPALWRTISLSRRPIVVNASVFRLVKVGAITAYAALQLALVVLAAAGHFHATAMFMATSVIKLLAAVAMLPLSVVEHSRTPRPSMLLMSYLILTLLLDAAQSRTLYLSLSSAVSTERAYSNLFTAAVAVKVVVLLLESQHKSRWVHWDKKEHSPEETSGIFSLGVFFWLNRLFLTGYNKVLSINDLYPLDGAMDPTRLHEKFSRHLDIPKMKGDKYGLTKVLMRTLIGPLLLPTIPRLALLGFSFAQPLFIEGLLNYLSGNMLNQNVGYGFIGASFFIYSGIVVSWAFHRYYHHRMRTMLRSILVTETFITATNARIGNDDSAALTLMSTDIERIRMGFRQLHDVWASLIQVALCAWMLDRRLGVVFVAPIVVVLLCFLSLAILMKFIGTAQRRWMSLVQKRVGLTATVIASMKNLKISGLSSSVSTFVQKLRVEELTAGVRYRKIYIGAALLGFIPLLISPALTFAFTQSRLDSSKVFTNLSFLTLMTQPLSQIFQTIPEVISGLACISRIQAFMECETREDFRKVAISFEKHSEKDSLSSQPSPESEVVIENGSFGWEQDKFVLQDINAKIPNSSLTLVVGPVGSGKSTLCKALLGEIPFHQGKVTLRTHASASFVGFCDQTAFVLNGTIKENIIGFSPVNEDRYAEVIEATSLAFDFDTLAQGDETNVGSDGISLSGGQKQRISLARALYLQAHFLILDDVFSGLDADTEEQVFRKVFGPAGLLRRRQTTVLLCTHSVRHLQAADHVIALGGDGGISEQGTFDALMAGNGYVHRVGLKGLSESKTTSEESSIENSAQESSSPAEKIKAAKLIVTPNMDASRKVGDGTVYKQYMKSMGRLLAGSAILFASLWGFFLNFSTICKYSMSLNTISALISLFLLGASIWIVSIKRAGANLHEDILKTLFRAPLRFFTETDIGVTTNLFSQDLNLIDTELPDATVSTLFSITQVIGQMAVMLTAAPYLAVTFPFLAALLYVLQKFYLRTSRQLRLLDLEAKSPLYTHFLDIVRGITTLRAFGFIREDIHKNARLLTSSQRPSYLLLMIQEWLNVVLDVVVMLLAVGLTTFAVRFHSNSSFTGAALYSLLSFGENLTGIVLFWTKLETSLGAIARLKTFTETVEPEDRDGEDIDAPEQWPQRGVVELKGVSAKYATEDQNDEATSLALRNIQLTINSGEKIAICGRTGSGKSSLVALLLKLLDPIATTAENIVIDDLPLHRLNRSVLRQRIIAVPQEAVFLPDGSTVQNNLDVSEEATPEECKTVLKSVGLWEFVKERGGLAAGMNSSSFSNGQRQLLSFGRALLRRSVRERKFGAAVQLGGILLLDEVSSSVDQETERIMQETIRTEFKNYTVIAVSHRLDMIMDFDRVVVMDTGEIVEVGKPAVLAREAGTRFGDLVDLQSSSESNQLVHLAQRIVQLALCLQQPKQNVLELRFDQPSPEMAHYFIGVASRYITSQDLLVDSLDGVETLSLEARFHLHVGNLQDARLLFRRALGIARLLLLPCRKHEDNRAESLWFRLVYSDRFLSLMLGLPFVDVDCQLTGKRQIVADRWSDQLERIHVVVVGRIIARNLRMQKHHGNQPDMYETPVNVYQETQDIDIQLKRASRIPPVGWWALPLLGNGILDLNSPEQFVRILTQMHQFYLVISLHQPYLLEYLSLESTPHRQILADPSPNYAYSKLAILYASRELLAHFGMILNALQNIPHRGFVEKAFSSAMCLLMIHMDGHRLKTENVLEHQRPRDLAVIDGVIHAMEEISNVHKDSLTQSCVKILSTLVRMEEYAANGAEYITWLEPETQESNETQAIIEDQRISFPLPYFGRLHVSCETSPDPPNCD
ncbi:hypothetical protein LT330_004061 [Penicillium expansum]|nr:hypothetical protein LT330_004061 [Penicillium expansum]